MERRKRERERAVPQLLLPGRRLEHGGAEVELGHARRARAGRVRRERALGERGRRRERRREVARARAVPGLDLESADGARGRARA
jgi:hypothetical protein